MSSVSTETGDTEIAKLTETPPLKTDPESEAEAEGIQRKGKWNDVEFRRQLEIFGEQYEKNEGYDVDWDNLDFYFDTLRLEDGPSYDVKLSNKELVEFLIKTAIKEENEEYEETNLEFVKYVSANLQAVQGFLFFITFWAKELNSPNQEPQLYQAKVRKFGHEILVHEFRLRPTQELLY